MLGAYFPVRFRERLLLKNEQIRKDRIKMINLNGISKEQREICTKGESILYVCKNNLGNFEESEVIKHGGKYYRICACNKHIKEFTEV